MMILISDNKAFMYGKTLPVIVTGSKLSKKKIQVINLIKERISSSFEKGGTK